MATHFNNRFFPVQGKNEPGINPDPGYCCILQLFVNGNFGLNLEIESIRDDLRSIRKETTASGNIRFIGEHTANGKLDRSEAVALALHGAKKSNAPRLWPWVI